jgi:hypothetical protein
MDKALSCEVHRYLDENEQDSLAGIPSLGNLEVRHRESSLYEIFLTTLYKAL